MPGIFERINGSAGNDAKLSPEVLTTAVWLRVAGSRTGGQLLTGLNSILDSDLNAQAQQDMLDIVAYVEAGSTIEQKTNRLAWIRNVLAGYETGVFNITEAEARTAMQVNWT